MEVIEPSHKKGHSPLLSVIPLNVILPSIILQSGILQVGSC
jgi:hypothetical protein